MLRPLGNRVIVKPDQPDTESDSGIIFPQTYGAPPAMSGTVVSVGRGAASAHRVRQATIARCVQLLNEVADRVPSASLRSELGDELFRYAVEDVRFSELSSGTYVAFSYTDGAKIQIDGEEYIVLDESDIAAAWTDESEAAQ